MTKKADLTDTQMAAAQAEADAAAAAQAEADAAAAAQVEADAAAAEQQAIADEIAEQEAAEKAAADLAAADLAAAEAALGNRVALPDFDDQFSKLQELVDLITDNLPFNQTAVRADLELRFGAVTTERHDVEQPDVFDMTCQGITVELCIGEKTMLENWAMAARRVLLSRPMVA